MEPTATPDDSSDFSVATWNMNMRNGGAGVEYLASMPWHVACLQEVSPAASDAIEEQGWAVINGLRLAWEAEYLHWKRWPSAAAIVARDGWSLTGEMMPGTPKPGRGIVARASDGTAELTVISWHAPNAADEGVKIKMAGYQALLAAINGVEGPVVAGIDSNHWSLSVDLDGVPFVPGSRFDLEDQFFSNPSAPASGCSARPSPEQPGRV